MGSYLGWTLRVWGLMEVEMEMPMTMRIEMGLEMELEMKVEVETETETAMEMELKMKMERFYLGGRKDENFKKMRRGLRRENEMKKKRTKGPVLVRNAHSPITLLQTKFETHIYCSLFSLSVQDRVDLN